MLDAIGSPWESDQRLRTGLVVNGFRAQGRLAAASPTGQHRVIVTLTQKISRL